MLRQDDPRVRSVDFHAMQPEQFNHHWRMLNPRIQAERQAIVNTLSAARSASLRTTSMHPNVGSQPTLTTSGGKLLICLASDKGVDDGVSAEESKGFFDDQDLPPWDTWIWYVNKHEQETEEDSYLVSWVPSSFIPLVERGIHVNPVNCLEWATEYRSSFTGQLRERGLL